MPQGEVWISQTMGEKFGSNEFEAKAYRTKAFQISVDQSKNGRLSFSFLDNSILPPHNLQRLGVA